MGWSAISLLVALVAIVAMPRASEGQAMPFLMAPMLRGAPGREGNQQAPFVQNLLAVTKIKEHLAKLHLRVKNGERFEFSKMGPLGVALGKINATIHQMIDTIHAEIERQKRAPKVESDSLDLVCAGHVALSLVELTNLNPWALQMFDAFGKLNDGIKWGNVEATGSFDECVQARAVEDVLSLRPIFQGQYCTVVLNTNLIAGGAAGRNTASHDVDGHHRRLKRRLRRHHSLESLPLPPFSIAMSEHPSATNGEGGKSIEALFEAGLRGLFPGYHGPKKTKKLAEGEDDSFQHQKDVTPDRTGDIGLELPSYYGNVLPFTTPGFGACMPSSCSDNDVAILLRLLQDFITYGMSIVMPFKEHPTALSHPGFADDEADNETMTSFAPVDATSPLPTSSPTNNDTGISPSIFVVVDCQIEGEKQQWDETDVIVTCVLAVLGCIILAGSLLDWRIRIANKPPLGQEAVAKWKGIEKDYGVQILLSFSALSNGEKILSTSRGKGVIGCLDGIRFISMTWVVLGHCFLFAASAMWVNSGRAFTEISHDFASMAITNATVSVDSFFFLSGFLVSYILLRQLERTNGRFNLILYYLHRYLRLTPALAAIIMLQVSIFRRMGDGPLWYLIEDTAEECRDTWWMNILYIGNFNGYDNDFTTTCIGQAWYLFCDMQLYIFSPLFILPLHYFKGKLGEACLGLSLVFFWASPMIVTAVNNFAPTLIFSFKSLLDPDMTWFFSRSYSQMYVRGGPYVIGIALGYIMFKAKGKKVTMKPWVVSLGWILATGAALAIIYGPKRYFEVDADIVPGKAESILWSMFRNVWALCLAWVVFACSNGYGGFVNTLLSWEAFAPLSRLAYSTYLLSVPIQMMYQASRKTPLWLDYIQIVYWYLAILIISMAVAFVFSLFFEMPFLGLEKVIFKPLENLSFGGSNKSKKEAKPVDHANGQGNELNGKMEMAAVIGKENPGFQPEAEPTKQTS